MTVDHWWNETDVLSYLEVSPSYDEGNYTYSYSVTKHDVHLRLTIAPYDRHVSFAVRASRQELSVFELSLLSCAGIEYINDKRGEYLQFLHGQISSSQHHDLSVFPYVIRLYAKQFIAIRIG